MYIARQIYMMVLLLLACSAAMADVVKDPAEAKQLTERIMSKVGGGDLEAGLRLAKPFLIIPTAEFEVMLDKLTMQQPMMAQRFGKNIGHEFIREEKVGQSLLRVVYIHRFEKHAMRWSFYFYRGSAGWNLNTFHSDDDIRQLFDH
jgi:hypothetical protein